MEILYKYDLCVSAQKGTEIFLICERKRQCPQKMQSAKNEHHLCFLLGEGVLTCHVMRTHVLFRYARASYRTREYRSFQFRFSALHAKRIITRGYARSAT